MPRPRVVAPRLLLFAACVVVTGGGCAVAEPPGIDVAVASSFAGVAETLAADFTARTGVVVRVASGSTGGLTTQIRSGAPYHLFLAADTVRPRELEADGLAVPGTRFTYAVGRLVVLAPGRSDGWSLPELLHEPGLHVAWADPRVAPYGAAAAAALEKWGLAGMDGAIALSVGQSLQFAKSGAVDAAFVARAQTIGEPPATVRLVADSLHPPLRQEAVLLRAGEENEAAAAFLAFLRTPEARAMIRAAGYEVEGDGDVV